MTIRGPFWRVSALKETSPIQRGRSGIVRR